LVRRGPAVGIMVYLATQKLDVKSIPSGISANASAPVCFKVNDATMFDFVKDKGIA
jgi:S-DNA-T family DNA segregation ATPase FtsK/SpoIIIE